MSVIAVRSPPSSTTANLTHGVAFSISGSGFGPKSRAVQAYLRDKCTAALGTADAQWSARNNLLSSSNIIQLHAAPFAPNGNSIPAPHPFLTQFYAGLHQGNPAGALPWTNFLGKSFTVPTLPCVFYVSWYRRGDPAVNFSLQTPPVNLKWFAYGDASGVAPHTVYYGNSSAFNSNAVVTASAVIGDNGQTNGQPNLQGPPDAAGHSAFYGQALNPFNPLSGWIFCEAEVFLTTTAGLGGGGYVNYYENGNLIGFYQGSTDGFSGTTRWFNVGSPYFNQYDATNTTNWLYCADIYGDFTGTVAVGARVAKVMMVDALGNRALQDLNTWSENGITGVCWKGACVSGPVSMLVTNEAGTTQTLTGFTLA